MNKITYLFGAGASANAVPLVNQIPDRLSSCANFLDLVAPKPLLGEKFNLNIQDEKQKWLYFKEAAECIRWLLNESKSHASVDTFAKKLFIKHDYENLNKLKIALSLFLTYEQMEGKVDPRYDSFYASILNNRNEFPKHVKVLSWNYDYQFELAYSEYSDENALSTNKNMLNIKAKNIPYRNSDGWEIYKLNGTAGFTSAQGNLEGYYHNNLKGKVDIKFIEEFTKNYVISTYNTETHPNLSFAWEEEKHDAGVLKSALNKIKDSIVTVVIGYSFPFFNREIDRSIFNAMMNLKRIYFQDPDPLMIIERFKAIREDLNGIELIPVKDIGQFFLPKEL